MATKKTKKSVKNISINAGDLEPAKDANGGRHHHHHGHQFSSLLNEKEEPGRTPPGGGYGIHMVP